MVRVMVVQLEDSIYNKGVDKGELLATTVFSSRCI